MNSIDSIISKIISDAEEYASTVKKHSANGCAEILEDAQSRASEIYSSVKTKGEAACAEIMKRASSSADIISKSILLNTKIKKLDEVFEKAEKRISELPSDEYYTFLLGAIKKAAELLGGGGVYVLRLNTRQREEYGEKTVAELRKEGKELVLGEDIFSSFGFLLSRDGTEINSSAETVMSEARRRLERKVSELLFA